MLGTRASRVTWPAIRIEMEDPVAVDILEILEGFRSDLDTLRADHPDVEISDHQRRLVESAREMADEIRRILGGNSAA